MTANLARTRHFDSALDLTIQRVIRAPKESIWSAWTEPDKLAQWWIPAPLTLRVDALELRPGGAFSTMMSEDGETFTPHVDAVFLLVEDNSRLVFTNAVNSTWHPVSPDPVSMTTEIILGDHPDGTDYQAVVRHGSPEQRARHEELGFFDGWGTVTEQLAQSVE
ncbi:SRPBCC domain-containing protein [Brevibacterium aurantiacum]|uniref:SRPBCC domain-containing protein n=1 Tax=Brevibacterium aurantiacum TaxID=273384 RepID=UPI000F63EB2C|nr:SRPBCC domain-containing protein [Brevibacterium aurantiacum]AZL07105.1 polyketide cyclase [Brevibacterium aurantiacum]AZL10701.1 polyketide cyclase [Brevibacterium aurantiacum]